MSCSSAKYKSVTLQKNLSMITEFFHQSHTPSNATHADWFDVRHGHTDIQIGARTVLASLFEKLFGRVHYEQCS